MTDEEKDYVLKYNDLVYKNKINESLNVLDRMIAIDNNNVYALLEKGFAKLFLNTDSSYHIDIVINYFNSSLDYVFKAIKVSPNKEKTLKQSYLKLIDQIIKYYLIFPKLVLIPYDMFMEKYSALFFEFEIDKTTSLDLLYNEINTYILNNHKIHGIKFGYIKELREEIEKLLKMEINNKVKIYWSNHKKEEAKLLKKKEILTFELQQIHNDHKSSKLYEEVKLLKENYEKIYINSREYKDKSKIKDYLNEIEIKKQAKKLHLLEEKLNNNNQEMNLVSKQMGFKISYYTNLLNTAKFKYVGIFDKVLKTKRLSLRRINDFDCFNMYEYAKKPGFGEKAGWPHHKNIEETKEVVRHLCFENTTFSIILNKTKKMIGTIGFKQYDQERFIQDNKYGFEMGFALSDDFSNNGYMTETVASLLDFLFTEIKVDYVTCGHFIGNNPSKRVIEKSGFVYLEDVFVKNCNRTVSYYIKFNKNM